MPCEEKDDLLKRTTDALSETGSLTAIKSDFQPRQSQIDMAATVATAIQGRHAAIIEAATGTGKTFAYLVPLVLSGARAVISTASKNLQEQLFERDVPAVARALGCRPKIAILKGRANYLCLYRLQAAQMASEQDDALAVSLASINCWQRTTHIGDLSEVSELAEESPLRRLVSATADQCLGSQCPKFEQCYVFKARRQAAQADVIIVNHHVLLADINLKQADYGELLPMPDVIVIDEAHQLPEIAVHYFSQTVSRRQVVELLSEIETELSSHGGYARQWFEQLAAVLQLADKLHMVLNQVTHTQRGAWPDNESSLEEAMRAWHASVVWLTEQLSSLADQSTDLARYYHRCEQLEVVLSSFINTESNQQVYWYELTNTGFYLHCSPLEISAQMSRYREQLGCAWIYTSATLSVAGQFKLFKQQLGLTEIDAECVLASPFDHERNTLLYRATQIPLPAHPDYIDRCIDAVVPLLEASRGRAFWLFTSHRALAETARRVRQRLRFPLLVQGEQPRYQLLETFRQTENGVLMGAASFWAGVDVVGDTLSCVIIDRLPFAAPGDPILEARIAQLKAQGINPFWEMQVPMAIIALKQGMGRLLRHDRDRGVLMVCDPRLFTTAYGRMMQRSLPNYPQTQSFQDVVDFFEFALVGE